MPSRRRFATDDGGKVTTSFYFRKIFDVKSVWEELGIKFCSHFKSAKMAKSAGLENRANSVEIGCFRDFKALQNRTDSKSTASRRENRKIRDFCPLIPIEIWSWLSLTFGNVIICSVGFCKSELNLVEVNQV